MARGLSWGPRAGGPGGASCEGTEVVGVDGREGQLHLSQCCRAYCSPGLPPPQEVHPDAREGLGKPRLSEGASLVELSPHGHLVWSLGGPGLLRCVVSAGPAGSVSRLGVAVTSRGAPWAPAARLTASASPTASRPPRHPYSLCRVLVLRPIVPDVRGGCDSTDDDRNPTTDKVEPAGMGGRSLPLEPSWVPQGQSCPWGEGRRRGPGDLASSSQSRAAPAHLTREPLLGRAPPPAPHLPAAAPPLPAPHTLLLLSPRSQLAGCCVPAEMAPARPQCHVAHEEDTGPSPRAGAACRCPRSRSASPGDSARSGPRSEDAPLRVKEK